MSPSDAFLGIGPANFAGQAESWSRAVEEFVSGVSATSFGYDFGKSTFAYEFDVGVKLPPVQSAPWRRRAQADRLLASLTHVAVDGFARVYSLPKVGSLLRDYRRVAGANRRLALISHGSDTRDPVGHMERVSDSYFRHAPQEFLDHASRVVRRNREVRSALGVPLFVSTPDLLADNPDASWLPLCVDVHGFSSPEPLLLGSRPRVLHLPSRRVPPIKGSHIIEPALEELSRRGEIDWVRSGSVAHKEMPKLLSQVDIVVDQLLVDSYGVSAVEAMAAGRVTIANVGESTRSAIGVDLPIIDVDPRNFGESFRGLLQDLDSLRDAGGRGPGFAQAMHGGERSANVLQSFVSTNRGADRE